MRHRAISGRSMLSPFMQCVASCLILLLPVLSHAQAVGSLLRMQVGEVRVFAVPDVARVAVGDGHVLNAVTTEEKEVIVFALTKAQVPCRSGHSTAAAFITTSKWRQRAHAGLKKNCAKYSLAYRAHVCRWSATSFWLKATA